MNATNILVIRQRVAFALAPALPALFYFILLEYTSSGDTGGVWDILIFAIAISVSYVSCFLLGAPLISFLKRKQHLNLVYLSVGGAVMGAVVFYLFGFGLAATLDSSRTVMPYLFELTWGAALGMLVALPFGLIAGYPLRGTVDDLE